MLRVIIGWVLVAWMPGTFLYRIPVADRAHRAGLAVEERAFWSVLLSLLWSTAAALVLAACGRYSFVHLLGTNAALALVILVTWRSRLRYDVPPAPVSWSAVAPVVLLAIGLWLYFPPAEYVIGGKDPGVYVNEGVQVAQGGSLVIRDTTLAGVPAAVRELFVAGQENDFRSGIYEGVRFMGFFITDQREGLIVGQFPHGLPAWMAIAYGLDGLTGVRQSPGIWAMMGLLAVYLLWSRLLGPLTACAGTALLAVNVAEVWFGRLPNSEVMQQTLAAAALLALARAYRDGDRFFDLVAAAALGVMIFVRIDTILLLGLMGTGFVLLASDGVRPRARLLIVLAIPAAVAVPYYGRFLRAYSEIPIMQLGGLRGVSIGTALLAAGVFASSMIARRWPAFTATVRTWLPRVLAMAVAVLATYAYFFREPGGRLASHDAYAFRSLGWYLSGPGTVAAVTGLCVLLWRDFWRDPVTLSTATGLSVFFLYKVRIVPEHFWQARRYLPLVLPLACIGIAVTACRLWPRRAAQTSDSGRGRVIATRAGRMTWAAVILATVGWSFVAATWPIRNHVEYAGVIPALEKLAEQFTDRDLVVVESRNASDTHVLATPLAYIYARHVLVLTSPRPNPAMLGAFVKWATGTYARVFFLADGGTALAIPEIDVTPVTSVRLELPEYESLLNAYPHQVRTKKFSLSVFALAPAVPGTPKAATDIDIGGTDDVWVVRINGKEQQGPVSYRWTRNVSYVNLLGIGPDSRRLTLWMSNGGRPAAAGDARVKVSLNDVVLGELTVREGFAPYELAIPPVAAAQAAQRRSFSALRLDSTVWSPKLVLGVPDDRQLGVMLDRVRVQ
jgi:hypothetical protein